MKKGVFLGFFLFLIVFLVSFSSAIRIDSFSVDKPEAGEGDKLTFSFKITNDGTSDLKGVLYSIDLGNGQVINAAKGVDIKKGKTYSGSQKNVIYSGAGNFNAVLTVMDKSASTSLIIKENKADLVVTELKTGVDPAVGVKTTISFKIYNQGTIKAENIEWSVQTGEGIISGVEKSIDKGKFKEIKKDYTYAGGGNYNLQASVDAANKIAELDETNNLVNATASILYCVENQQGASIYRGSEDNLVATQANSCDAKDKGTALLSALGEGLSSAKISSILLKTKISKASCSGNKIVVKSASCPAGSYCSANGCSQIISADISKFKVSYPAHIGDLIHFSLNLGYYSDKNAVQEATFSIKDIALGSDNFLYYTLKMETARFSYDSIKKKYIPYASSDKLEKVSRLGETVKLDLNKDNTEDIEVLVISKSKGNYMIQVRDMRVDGPFASQIVDLNTNDLLSDAGVNLRMGAGDSLRFTYEGDEYSLQMPDDLFPADNPASEPGTNTPVTNTPTMQTVIGKNLHIDGTQAISDAISLIPGFVMKNSLTAGSVYQLYVPTSYTPGKTVSMYLAYRDVSSGNKLIFETSSGFITLEIGKMHSIGEGMFLEPIRGTSGVATVNLKYSGASNVNSPTTTNPIGPITTEGLNCPCTVIYESPGKRTRIYNIGSISALPHLNEPTENVGDSVSRIGSLQPIDFRINTKWTLWRTTLSGSRNTLYYRDTSYDGSPLLKVGSKVRNSSPKMSPENEPGFIMAFIKKMIVFFGFSVEPSLSPLIEEENDFMDVYDGTSLFQIGRAGVIIDNFEKNVALSKVNFNIKIQPSPLPPSGLTYQKSIDEVVLNWETPDEELSGFVIERKKAGGEFEFLSSVEAGVNSFSDDSASSGNYVYKVCSMKDGWLVSYDCPEVSVSADIYPMIKVPALDVYEVEFNDGSVSEVFVIPEVSAQIIVHRTYIKWMEAFNFQPYLGLPIDKNTAPFKQCSSGNTATQKDSAYEQSLGYQTLAWQEGIVQARRYYSIARENYYAITESELNDISARSKTKTGQYSPPIALKVYNKGLALAEFDNEGKDIIPIYGEIESDNSILIYGSAHLYNELVKDITTTHNIGLANVVNVEGRGEVHTVQLVDSIGVISWKDILSNQNEELKAIPKGLFQSKEAFGRLWDSSDYKYCPDTSINAVDFIIGKVNEVKNG